MLYEWIETTVDVYRAIYSEHKDNFGVFETYTEHDEIGDQLKAQITAWGFNDAEHPIIKSELRNFTEWKYYLLRKAEEEEEE